MLVDVAVGVAVGVAVPDGLDVVVKLWTTPAELFVALRATAYHSYSVLFAKPVHTMLAFDPEGTVIEPIKLKSGERMVV